MAALQQAAVEELVRRKVGGMDGWKVGGMMDGCKEEGTEWWKVELGGWMEEGKKEWIESIGRRDE